MKKHFLPFCCVLFTAISGAYAQTWGCGEKDFKCQLDVRMKALKDDPKNPENYYNLGIVMQRAGAHKEAVETFGMYVTIPDVKPELRAEGYNNRGISLRRLDRPDLAHADYTKAIELNGKNPLFYVNRAAVSGDMGKLDEALRDFDRAIEADPRFALAYTGRANTLVRASRYDEAIRDLTKAIELDAANPESYYTRAMAYRAKEEFAKAIPDLDKYIALGPGNDRYLADGHLNRGIAHVMAGNTGQAEKDFTKAIELAPDYADAYGARAMLYRQLKKGTLADADEKKIAELKAPRTSFDFLRHGSAAYMVRDYKKAIPFYQKALDLEKRERKLPRHLWIVLVDNLSMAHGISGDIKSSQAVIEYGISVEPRYPLFYYNMACGYGELGDEENAIKWLRPAFEHRLNMLPGTALPDPLGDSSFAKFRNSEKFKKAIAEMKKGSPE